jgi:prolyl oligopeptidase
MKTIIAVAILFLATTVTAQVKYNYPASRTEPVTDDYFGMKVIDNYRWMENLRDTTVQNWFKVQGHFTDSILQTLPVIDTLISEMEVLDTFQPVKYNVMELYGNSWFIQKRLPQEKAYKMYRKDTSAASKEELLFDPADFIKGKTVAASYSISDDGRYLLLLISQDGNEQNNIYAMDVATKKILPDTVRFAEGGFTHHFSDRFFYLKYNSGNIYDESRKIDTKCMMHIIGTPVSSDREIMSRKKYPELGLDSSDFPYCYMPASGSRIIITAGPKANSFYYADSNSIKSTPILWKLLFEVKDSVQSFIVHENDIYAVTTKGNIDGRLVKTGFGQTRGLNGIEIYIPDKGWIIQSITETKHFLLIMLSHNNIQSRIISYEYATGKLLPVDNLPVKGWVYLQPYSPYSDKCVLSASGWNIPDNNYEYDLASKQASGGPFHLSYTFPALKNVAVEEVEIPSYDGTLVPLSIMYDSTLLKKDGSNICLMQGYGAYGLVYPDPFLNTNNLPLLSRGVVMAFAHVRGGGEKGESWHLAGFKSTKPNTWKDFNACARYLITKGYTSSPKLSCLAGSAGGILIGRAVTEEPGLFKAAIIANGMMNTMRFENSPNGPDNVHEFGTVKDSADSRALYTMDAFHHIQEGTHYPAQMLTCNMNDARVANWQTGKYIAAMQQACTGNNPVLVYVNYHAGHLGGTTTEDRFKVVATYWAFVLWQCGYPDFQPKK